MHRNKLNNYGVTAKGNRAYHHAEVVRSKTKFLKLTKHLQFHIDCTEDYEYVREKNRSGYNFKNIIDRCDPQMLTSLTFSRVMFQNSFIYISKLIKIKVLVLDGLHNIGLEWHQLKLFKKLNELKISDCLLNDHNLSFLKKLKRLNKLELRSCPWLTWYCTIFITRATQLQKVNLIDCKFSFSEWPSCFDKLLELQELDLSFSNIQDGFFISTSAVLSQIRTLNISYCLSKEFSDVGLYNICNSMRSLQRLDLGSCGVCITDLGLAHLCKLIHLRHLELKSMDNITDAGLKHISKMNLLSYMYISFCSAITNKGVGYISCLPTLKELNLIGCKLLTRKCLKVVPKSCFVMYKK